MEIIRSPNCGNSPKNAFIEDFIVQLFSKEDVKDKVVDNISIDIAGTQVIYGIDELLIEKIFEEEILGIEVYDAISHGKKGAIDLKVHTITGKVRELGIFLEFKSLKADRIARLKVFISAST